MATSVATVDPKIAQLLALADELGLTARQRRFAEAWVADPKHIGVHAAREAGYAGDYHNLGVTAHDNLNNPKIQRYIQALLEAAGAHLETASAVASAQEVLEALTSHMRADMADFWSEDQNGRPSFDLQGARKRGKTRLIKEITLREGADKDGMPWTETRLKLVDQQAAADKLARYYALYRDEDKDSAVQVTVLAVLNALPAQAAKEIARALLAGPVVEEEAERVE